MRRNSLRIKSSHEKRLDPIEKKIFGFEHHIPPVTDYEAENETSMQKNMICGRPTTNFCLCCQFRRLRRLPDFEINYFIKIKLI